MRPRGDQQMLARRRKRAVALVLEGKRIIHVAEQLGVAPRSVSRWVSAHRQDGDQGLQARKNTGRPCRLTFEQRAQLDAWLTEQTRLGHEGAKFPWKRREAVQWINEHFHRTYNLTHFSRILKGLGWHHKLFGWRLRTAAKWGDYPWEKRVPRTR